jgi:MFS family permease
VGRTREGDGAVAVLLVSLFCSSLGGMLLNTVLGIHVYAISHRELDLGLLGLAAFAPSACLVLVTGSVADLFDRRRVAAVALGGQAVVATALLWYASTSPTAVGPIFGLVLLFGLARAFASPATRSLPADLVPPARLPKVIARYAVTMQVSQIAGPVAGGFLYAADVRLPYAAAMALTAAAAVTILRLRLPARPARALDVTPAQRLHDAVEGLRVIRGNPVLLGAISLDLFAVLFGGAIALLPAIAEDRLGVGAVGLGWLRAAGGIGAASVALVLAFRPLARNIGRSLFFAVGVFGVGTIVLGSTRQYVVAFAAMVVLTGADAVSMFIRSTLVPLATPAATRGRVLAFENVFIGASNELGAFESGVAGQLLGPAGAIVLGGVATLAIAGSWGWLFPGLRGVDGFPSPAATDTEIEATSLV